MGKIYFYKILKRIGDFQDEWDALTEEEKKKKRSQTVEWASYLETQDKEVQHQINLKKRNEERPGQ